MTPGHLLSGAALLFGVLAQAQSWDPGRLLNAGLSSETHGTLAVSGEVRARYESREGSLTGKDTDNQTGLVRTRLSLSWKPSKWLRVSGMVQDARAPWYGPSAPSTLRDSVDLQESYIELLPDAKSGFGLTAGRMMLTYGDGRLIGSPQWSNLARTFDHGRAFYRLGRARFEVLMVSPVKIRQDEFNHPVLGERIWGTYNTHSDLWRKSTLDWYVLRHDQNRVSGFVPARGATGDRLEVNTFGLRMAGPVTPAVRYTAEVAIQNGQLGGTPHRARAWAFSSTRRLTVSRRVLDVTAEYKHASGGPAEAGTDRTFDQLSPANHDKFGHEDLFGWRNIHNAKVLATYALTKKLSLNAMYDNYWLADARDALYSGAGKLILRAAAGNHGRHVGQEADLFCTFRVGHLQLGGGYGHFLAGEFVERTGARRSPVYLYVFHNYTF